MFNSYVKLPEGICNGVWFILEARWSLLWDVGLFVASAKESCLQVACLQGIYMNLWICGKLSFQSCLVATCFWRISLPWSQHVKRLHSPTSILQAQSSWSNDADLGWNETCWNQTSPQVSILLGGLEHEFYDFPYIGNFIIPTDELIYFSEGLKPPTSIYIYVFLTTYLSTLWILWISSFWVVVMRIMKNLSASLLQTLAVCELEKHHMFRNSKSTLNRYE